MTLRIIFLSENTARLGAFIGEWGLSVLIETATANVLMDTGNGFSTVYNADTLDIDLSKVDKIVLSHGHCDHTGGLRYVLRKIKKEVEIIAHPDIWQEKYARRQGEPDRFIGIPFSRTLLESLGAKFVLTNKSVKITENLLTTGEIPVVIDFEKVEESLFIKENNNWQYDKLADDQAVIIVENKKLVVILGCAHRGIINTLYHARKLTGLNDIYAVFGGSHLMGASEEQLWQTIGILKEMDIQKIGLCHCTDLPAISVLAQEFGDRFVFIKAGSVINI